MKEFKALCVKVARIADLYDNKSDLKVRNEWSYLIEHYNIDLCLKTIKDKNLIADETENLYHNLVNDLESLWEYSYSLIYTTT